MADVTPINTIPSDQAWRIFADWNAQQVELGVLCVSQTGTFFSLGKLQAARNGRVVVRGEAASASLQLKDAQFSYGPMQTWPRWPGPPIVEIVALQAVLPNGTWVVMADGLRPDALPQAMLPA